MNAYPKKKWEPELKLKSAKVSRTGDFTNDQNLKIRWYSWEVPKPKAIIVFAHGLGVYGSFEMLASIPPGTPRVHYASSWPERMNKSDVSLFCIDHQGHGRSDSASPGKRCYFHRLDDLVRDFARFCTLIRGDVPGVPLFVVGTSLGGFVATKTAMEFPDVANGLVTLAPMLSLDQLCKRPLNRVLLPFTTLLSMFIPTVPLAKTVRNTKFPLTQQEVEQDAHTWASGVNNTRVRVAAEAYLSTLKLKKAGELEKITMPVISFHGKDDPMTDPSSSTMLIERANTADKHLEWVDDVFHDLCHEKPTSDHICEDIIAWCIARVNGPVPKKSGDKRSRETTYRENGVSDRDAARGATTKRVRAAATKTSTREAPGRRPRPRRESR